MRKLVHEQAMAGLQSNDREPFAFALRAGGGLARRTYSTQPDRREILYAQIPRKPGRGRRGEFRSLEVALAMGDFGG
jgi:hypothetical protein